DHRRGARQLRRRARSPVRIPPLLHGPPAGRRHRPRPLLPGGL
ncbi:MAG: hypothetical protein AVDCRST_MAG69-652, partial [uncultured Solirubrobacteraceae bacterium]